MLGRKCVTEKTSKQNNKQYNINQITPSEKPYRRRLNKLRSFSVL